MHQIFWKLLRHIGTFVDYLGGVDTPAGWVPVTKTKAKLSKDMGRVGRSVFQLLLGPHAPNVLWRFLRHIGRFLDHLGDVDTPIGRALAPKLQAKLNKYMESGEINISASIRASHIKFGLEVSETHKNISRPLWDIKTPAGRMSVPKAEPSWANTFGVRSSISQLLLGPHAPNFWEVPETHRNIPRLPGRWWHTCRQSTSAQKMNPQSANTWGVGSSISRLPLKPHAPHLVWRFLRHIGTFLDNLWGVDTPAERLSALKTGLCWANARGEWEGQYLSFY